MGIGAILVEQGVISEADLEAAVSEHRETGIRLDTLLVNRGVVRPDEITRAVASQFGLEVVDLSGILPDEETLAAIPPNIVFRHRCVPIGRRQRNGGRDVVRVATCDPSELTTFDELHLLIGSDVELVLTGEEELREYIRTHYGVGGDTLEQMAQQLEEGDELPRERRGDDEADAAQEASVIRLVNELLFEAIDSRATDVHIEPYEHRLIVRYRVDGVLQRANVPATIHAFASAIVSRVKIMSSLDIAEKRKPQDGRITLRRKGETYDLRVSIIPMLFGEGVVLRILNKSAALMRLDDLGMPPGVLEQWDEVIAQPHGILLVTGPTGSGKSTTLYASLNRIVSDEIKAVTVEDPVEYHVGGVNQIQVNTRVGLDFGAGLRSILRHDPDVIMIGEIRDRETAEAAVQASLTGHLVFSTLHTNDAAGAIPRLLDMGVEPYLAASSVEAILAQRLVRRVCADCGRPHKPSPAELPPDFPVEDAGSVRRGEGCKSCFQTGYRGRIGVYELLRVYEPIREFVMRRANTSAIAATAAEHGWLHPLRRDGYAKVRAGVTTISEVLRVAKS